MNSKQMKTRLKWVCAIFAMVFAAVLYKSFSLTVLERHYLKGKADAEITGHLELGAVRGEIFDANGERLAASLAVNSLYADASLIPAEGEVNRETVALALSETLGLEREWVKGKLDSGKKFIYLKRPLSSEEYEAVRALKLPGIGFKKEYRRAYPNGSLASNFLGFVGIDGQGLEGLELSLDKFLKAGQEKLKVKQDRLGRFLVDKIDGELEQNRGASAVLTIDRRIQYITEKALAKAVTNYHAKSGMALVMNPRTGAVISAAVWPTYDPNNYKSADNDSRRNRILTDPFEPGSTFKIFVVAAALEEGLVTPETTVFAENGAFRVANHTVRDTHNYGDLTISQVIKYSSNIGSLKIGAILQKDLLYNYLTRFSFGEKTGLAHLSGEAPGVLRHPGKWHPIDEANIAFGQGLSVTALQMVMAMSSLANDGLLMRPYIVDRVLDSEGRIIEKHEPQILRQVVSPLTARQVAAMLRMAVQKGGTATRAEVAGYPVAGKTGTAQKVTRGGRGYAEGKYVASFIGFAPYHDPQLAVMVVLDEPSNGYYGGTVATPAFKEIMENALPLLDIPPTSDKGDPVWPILERNSGGAPGVVDGGQPTNFIRVRLKKNDRRAREPITFGEKKPDQSLNLADAVFVDMPALDIAPGVMPDLQGLTMRQVLDVMGDYELELEFSGSGRVIGQSPPPGTAVMAGQSGSIFFDK
ncbi:MAG: transpeptidase family protein [Candidatus Adiutrix sp.]|jgi:cell division protein FtsI (penicillin-binding protein 3)|nr:transpeptidase family protein [Candidatus Adiutrix sp.]